MTTDRHRPYDVLLLDFGGVCLLNPAELHHVVEAHFDLAPGTFEWQGPLDPGADALYQESIGEGGITERDYWTMRAAEVGRTAGIDLDVVGYMSAAYSAPGDRLIRPEAVDVSAKARALGMGVSVFTNDLSAFHDQEWVARIDFLSGIDHLIDCSHSGFLKPHPRAYEWAIEQLGDVDPARILFVDDQPLNVEGAKAAGLTGFWFDIADAMHSWDKVAARLV